MCSRYWIIAVLLHHSVEVATAGTTPAVAKPDASSASVEARTVNRTVPKVIPPKIGLEFSGHPTTEEISNARVFDEQLVPVGGTPGAEENAAIAAALLDYAKRKGTDDFSSLTGFLEKNPKSAWAAALHTCLGIDYYNTAHYSLALDAWEEAWALGKTATTLPGKLLADRTVAELAALYSRLGRMDQLEALLKSVEQRVFMGSAVERMNIAREALSMMQIRPEVSFRCGPLALQSIKRSLNPSATIDEAILNCASTHQGFPLSEVAALSQKIGLNYQMAFREVGRVAPRAPHGPSGNGARGATRRPTDFIVPSVVHWKVGHYAAIVRQEGDRYLIEDPTFVNTVWATRQTLESEASGYFLIPSGKLPGGWRSVDSNEGKSIWGKGTPALSDANIYGWNDLQTGSCSGDSTGMAVSSVHLMLANLQVRDTPVGYTPPVGPPVRFTVRYNQRDYLQPSSDVQRLLGPKWTHDWNESLKTEGADMKYIVGGGGARIFTSFNPSTQTYAPNQYDQTLLKRTGTTTFEMTWPDGSRKLFGPLIGTQGVLLSQVIDPAGNAITLDYDNFRRLIAVTDAIGQVTTLSYQHPTNPDLLTKVTDPFGRFASFDYARLAISKGTPNPGCTNLLDYFDMDLLVQITDVIGLQSRFSYDIVGSAPTNHACEVSINNPPILLFTDVIRRTITPYGNTSFAYGTGTNANNTRFRFVETRYPDGSSDRVEYNQSDALGIPSSDPAASIPVGVAAHNTILYGRNTYYWSRTAEASSQGSHTKAKIFHWLHTADISSAAGILSSTKEPLEGRVWYDYPGGGGFFVGSSDKPAHVGRVLDDGQTQLYTMEYNSLGHVTRSVDPLGRTFSRVYATNGIDLVEVRQTRAGNNELLFRATYNNQHRPLTVVDAAGQTNTFTYNDRGQVLTATDPKGGTTTYTYDAEGKPFAVDGPLAGTNDTIRVNYDAMGRPRTVIGLSGYTLGFEYDDLDRLTKVTHPDGTFEQFTYDRLDLATFRDRAGRQAFVEYDSMRQLKKQTDALGRVTRFDWCRCGQIKSLTDPMGNTTTWLTDVQGRPTAKRYADGSEVTYQYENTASRLRFVVDEKQQVTQYEWNLDDTLRSLAYNNAVIPTPGVTFTYDPDHQRTLSMTDGTGTTRYSYNPITTTPTLGSGSLASVDGPLANDTITYKYDELNRPVHRAINEVGSSMTLDAAGRLVGVTNALGIFAYGYDGATIRLLSKSRPNGQTEERAYGNDAQDRTLERITFALDATKVSEFIYGHDITKGRITTWSQQTGAQSPNLFSFGYDAINQLLSSTITNAGTLVSAFSYAYDPSGNRLTEQVGASNYIATYNGLNEIRTTTAPGITRTNEWDAQDRLVAVNVGNQRTEFAYDGWGRRVAIRQLVNGSQVSLRRFVWCDEEICEERDAGGAVIKRFFPQGVKVESGPTAGVYFYTRDHLGSVRELVDGGGNVRARYAYDPWGRRTRLAGDLETDFGFAGMFWCAEANLSLTHYRAYDPDLGRWLSRDPLPGAEMWQGPNLYTYVLNDPVNQTDPSGLFSTLLKCFTPSGFVPCAAAGLFAAQNFGQRAAQTAQNAGRGAWQGIQRCGSAIGNLFSRAPSTPAPTQPLSALETEIAALEAELPAFQRQFESIVQRLPEARRQWQAFETSIRTKADFPATDRWLEVYGRVVPGSPQIIVDLEAELAQLGQVAPHLHGILARNFNSLEMGSRWLGF